MRPRADWVDVAKGGAISLVVLGHAWRGLYAKGLVPKDVFSLVDSAIYAFHMPMFFMISGFFFFGWIRDNSLQKKLRIATSRLLVPLILWTYIFLFTRWLFSDFTNARPDVTSLLVLPIPGVLHFWFLWTLWVIQIGFLLFAALFQDRVHAKGMTYVSLILAFVLWVFAPDLPYQPYLGAAYNHAIFFVFGAILYCDMRVIHANWITSLGAGGSFIGLIALTASPEISRLSASLLALGLSVSFLVLVKSLSDMAPRGLLFLRWVGIFSFAIYMMHTIFSAGAREILLLLGITSLSMHLCLGVLAGLICPIFVNLFASQYRFGAVLGLRSRWLHPA